MFDTDQDAAAQSVSAMPISVAPPARPASGPTKFMPKHTSPTAASAMPISKGRLGRSPRARNPNSAVKNTWVCISTLASAAVMPSWSAKKPKLNWPTPWNSPKPTTQRQPMRGGRTRNTMGRLAAA